MNSSDCCDQYRPSALETAEMLGGPRTLGMEVRSMIDLHDAIRRGILADALLDFADYLSIPVPSFAGAFGIAESKLYVIYGRDEALDVPTADRLCRAASLAVLASRILGDRAAAGTWLVQPQSELGGQTPLQATRTSPGTELAEALLHKLATDADLLCATLRRLREATDSLRQTPGGSSSLQRAFYAAKEALGMATNVDPLDEVSDVHAARYIHMYRLLISAFGTPAQARYWLQMHNDHLGCQPATLTHDDTGVQRIIEYLQAFPGIG